MAAWCRLSPAALRRVVSMFTKIVMPLKEGLPPGPLVELAEKVAAPGASVHLVTLLKFDSGDPELDGLREAEATLQSIADGMRSDLEVTVEVGPAVAAAALTLLNIARHREADLLVIGLGKRTRVGKALMGSDAQRILIGSSCPVIVRPLYGVDD
jgi:nucleotide-binding universal stress UspA family protein